MACCEIMSGTIPPSAPPDEGHIPIYVDRSSKKVYYWNGTGWDLIWEIPIASDAQPGLVRIDPSSPITLGPGGALLIDCGRLKTQCNLATTTEVAAAITSAINALAQSIGQELSTIRQIITSLNDRITTVEAGNNTLASRIANIEAWDFCQKTAGCGYLKSAVTKISAGNQFVQVTPTSGTGDVSISVVGVSPPPPPSVNGGFLDYGGWRIMMGGGNTTTGYLDEIGFVAPFDGVFAINITEGNAVGWGAPDGGHNVTAGPSVFGWTRHPSDPNNKFLVSVGIRNVTSNEWKYSGGVTFSYIAYGKKP